MSTSDPPRVELLLLGGFKAQASGLAVEDRAWRGRKSQQLLKLLAVTPGHRLHREQIVEHLWPSLDPASADNQLNKTISAARRALEPGLAPRQESRFLLVEDRTVSLDPAAGIEIDAATFEGLAVAALASGSVAECEAALERYGGELLPGDLYESWAGAPRARLSALHERLLTRAGELHLEATRFDRAVDAFRRAVALDATNERARRGLMLAYARSGDRHRALQQYSECVAALDGELGVGPSAETEALRALLESDGVPTEPAPRPAAGEMPPAAAAPRPEARASRPERIASRRLFLVYAVAVVGAAVFGLAVPGEAYRMLGAAGEGAGASGLVAIAGSVDAPGSRVYVVGSKAGWAFGTGPGGRFVVPGVRRQPGGAYDVFVSSGADAGRLVTVRAREAASEGEPVEVGLVRFADGREVAAESIPGLDVAGRIRFDEANRAWYEGVFKGVTAHCTTDAGRIDAVHRFVASRFTTPATPEPSASPRETIENGSRYSGPLTLAMATLAHAGGYAVRVVDMTAEGSLVSHGAVEVFYDGEWRLYDAAYGARALNSVGGVAGYGGLLQFPELLASLDLSAEARPGWRTDEIRRFYGSGIHRVYHFER